MELKDITGAFRNALERVWGASAARVRFEVQTEPPPNGGVLAALRYDRNPAKADGRVLLRHASNHVLVISARLLQKSAADVELILLHEAIHVGRPRHDAEFDKIALEVGAALTEQSLDGTYRVQLQTEPHRRFRDVYVATDMMEARAFAEAKKAGAGRYRITY